MIRVLLVLLTFLVGGFSSQAFAVDFEDGLYYGFNFGAADNLTLCDELEGQFIGFTDDGDLTDIFTKNDTDRRNFNLNSPSKCKDTDFGLQIFAGWQLMKWLAFEGGWTDLDSTTYTDPDGTGTKVETSGWQVNAVGTLPILERAGIYFKLGAFNWDLDSKQTFVTGETTDVSTSGTDFVYGLALRYPLTDTIGVSLEVQRFEDIGNSQTGDIDINLWTAGFLLRL